MEQIFGSLKQSVRGKVVVVTGASDGIGAHLAPRLAAAGARVLLVARTPEKLRVIGDLIRSAGGEAHEYIANLSEDEECQRVVREILADHGYVDIFISNAGRSIRRSAKFQGSDRFHDFHRLMALNFYGALRLVLGLLPSMAERGSGHIVHVSSFGVPTRQPRFSGYCASKSALDAALQSLAGEVASKGISTSSVYMPLVKTKMVESKGHNYDHLSLLTLDMACDLIEHAIMTKEAEVTDAPSRFLALLYFFRPSLIVGLNSVVYRLENEVPPEAACSEKVKDEARRKKQNGAASSSFSVLKALGSLLAFFSRLEMFCMKIGVAWILRDPIILLILSLVLLVQPIIAAALVVCRLCRKGMHGKPLQAYMQACTDRTAHRPSNDAKVRAAPGSSEVPAAVQEGAPNTRFSLHRVKSQSCADVASTPRALRTPLRRQA